MSTPRHKTCNVEVTVTINLNATSGCCGNTATWTGQIRAFNPHRRMGIDYQRIVLRLVLAMVTDAGGTTEAGRTWRCRSYHGL
ncbi:hypothetical protein Tsubulata_018342 [Turnera subulata]|uniref:Uncharacterized protein n=1 Tax=Turnera subulata TaxID=218843 RepID=A0A9Q0G3N3_9ROSI|nr:hypothetical protein Tsubulata_018342 [Turnera subulata]